MRRSFYWPELFCMFAIFAATLFAQPQQGEQAITALKQSGQWDSLHAPFLGAERAVNAESVPSRSRAVNTSTAETWIEEQKIDNCCAVAVSGDTAVIRNAVYVLTGGTWLLQSKLSPPAAIPTESFGYAVAIDGDTVVIGAPALNTCPCGPGPFGDAYIFTRSGGVWSLQVDIPSGASTIFGASVSLSGDTVAIGAPGDILFYWGTVFIYTRSGTTWSPQAEWQYDADSAGWFGTIGSSVALSGDTLAYSQVKLPDFYDPGRVWFYERSGTGWPSQGTFVPGGVASAYSLSVSGDTVVLGVPERNSSTGTAYVLTRSSGAWSVQTQLTAPDAVQGDSFGSSVSLSGDTAIIAAPGKNSSQGAVYVFARSGSTWSLQQTLTASDGASNDFFGTSVSLDGNTAVISKRPASGTGRSAASYVFLYTTIAPAQMSTPPAGSTVSGSSQQFNWSAGSYAADYWLSLGTYPGGADVYSQELPAGTTSVNVGNIPTGGGRLYVQLSSRIGGTWYAEKYTYEESGTAAPAQITNLAGGATLAGASQEFDWGKDSGASGYMLWLGTTPGKHDVYIGRFNNTVHSTTVTGIPTNGVNLYATIYTAINDAWQHNTYIYSEAGSYTLATMLAPTPGAATILANTANFTWNPGAGATTLMLWVGTTPGGHDIYDQRFSPSTTSASVSGIPTNGVELSVTLYSLINNAWQRNSYLYTESGSYTLATITSPPTTSPLPGDTVTFTWDPGAGPNRFYLYIGSTPGGSDLYSGTFAKNVTTAKVSGLPTDGRTIYVTLDSYINLIRKPQSYSYTAAGP